MIGNYSPNELDAQLHARFEKRERRSKGGGDCRPATRREMVPDTVLQFSVLREDGVFLALPRDVRLNQLLHQSNQAEKLNLLLTSYSSSPQRQ